MRQEFWHVITAAATALCVVLLFDRQGYSQDTASVSDTAGNELISTVSSDSVIMVE